MLPVFYCFSQQQQQPTATNIKLSNLFSNDMILQRDIACNIWGTADPKGDVVIKIEDKEFFTSVDASGHWESKMPAFKAGGPYHIEIFGKNETIKIDNILFGDVWIASGQSNMEMAFAGADNYEKEIKTADNSNIRFFTVPLSVSNIPQTDVQNAKWVTSSTQTAGKFSAVAYFFAKKINKELDVPIGIIQSAVGGTPAEFWISKEMLNTIPEFYYPDIGQSPNIKPYHLIASEARQKRNAIMQNASENVNAIQTTKKFKDWNTMPVPGLWESSVLPDFDGFVWFRKTVDIPKNYAGKKLVLSLGVIDDNDITWFNGKEIGRTNGVNKERQYDIPENLVKAGDNEIIIRILDTGGGGGFFGDGSNLMLQTFKGENLISLTGNWSYNETLEPEIPSLKFKPSYLYNAMVAPLIPFSIKGAIWYQGENNAFEAYQYQTLFPTLIEDWRVRFKQGYFPFLYVQLANFMERKPEPADDAWAELREAQSMVLKYPNTGMAVTIDIGDGDDIHPKNKFDVGQRLSLAALKIAYNHDLVYSGPIYKSMEVKNNTIEIVFSNIGSGLKMKNDSDSKVFAVAGTDKIFHWAYAEIKDNKIIVSSPMVSNPVAVRYAWAANPEATLYNNEGLPASPFRTDTWTGITEK